MPENIILNNRPLPTVGVDMLYIAVLEEETETGELVYANSIRIPGLAEVGWSPDVQAAAYPADNGIYENASQMGKPTLTVKAAQLPPEVDALLLGSTYADGLTEEKELNQPDVAVMYRIKLSDGSYAYRTVYKCKPQPPAENAQTQGETLSYQDSTIVFDVATTARGIRRKLQDSDKNLKAELKSQKGLIAQKWFEDPLWDLSVS